MKSAIVKLRYLIVLLLLGAFLTISSNAFLTFSNIVNVLWSVCTVGIIAVFATLLILNGKIDLSVGGIVALSGIITVTGIVERSWPLPPAIVAGVAAGMLIGCINGLFVTRTQIPDFIVTFSVNYMLTGVSQMLTHGGKTISAMTYDAFTAIGNGKLFNIPYPIYIFTAMFAVSYFVLNNTTYGRKCYLCGGNPKAARLSGINPRTSVFLAYMLTGAAAGISGVVLSALTQQANSQAGFGYELNVIAAVVIGGTLMSGGVGNMVGTLFGVLLVGFVDNGMNLLGLPGAIEPVVKGVIIIGAVALNDYLLLRQTQKKPAMKDYAEAEAT